MHACRARRWSMRFVIAAIGKLKDKGEIDLVQRFTQRIDGSGRALALGPLALVEFNESRAGDPQTRKNDEAQRLLAAVSSADRRVVLDVRGKLLSSAQFASTIASARDGGTRELAFLIGGPDGHGEVARQSADLLLSLGPMTLPHALARAVLAEQIYRAITIIGGHPYHRS